MSVTVQRQHGLDRANEVRSAKAVVRQQLRAGTLALRDVLLCPPAELSGELLIDVVRLWWPDPRRSSHNRRMRGLGASALRAGVNLALTLGAASYYEREWVALWCDGHLERRKRNRLAGQTTGGQD